MNALQNKYNKLQDQLFQLNEELKRKVLDKQSSDDDIKLIIKNIRDCALKIKAMID